MYSNTSDEQELVTIKESTPKPGVPPQRSVSGKYTIQALPIGTNDKNMFRGVVVPTFYTFMGIQDTPWNVLPPKLVEAEQEIWNTIYNIEHTVTKDGPIYGVVNFAIVLALPINH